MSQQLISVINESSWYFEAVWTLAYCTHEDSQYMALIDRHFSSKARLCLVLRRFMCLCTMQIQGSNCLPPRHTHVCNGTIYPRHDFVTYLSA